MRTFLKYYLKYIIMVVVFAVAFICFGISNINGITELEGKKSSYTRTEFDYIITAPSAEQVKEVEAYSSVKAVFPCFNLTNAFGTGSKSKDIILMLSDDMSDWGISLFSEKTIVEGEYSESGVMLDVTAADALGVGVGDSVKFTVGGQSYTKVVSAIGLACTYTNYDKGIALISCSAVGNYSADNYLSAFVQANDGEVSAVSVDLASYIGDGEAGIMTFEEYLGQYTMRDGDTQEEFEARYKTQYEEYYAAAIAKINHDTQVASKADAYSLLETKLENSQKEIDDNTMLVAIATGVLFAVLQVIFMITNRGDDAVRRDNGMGFGAMFLFYVAVVLISAALAYAIGVGVLAAVASGTYFTAECMAMVWQLTLGIPIAAAAVVLGSLLYVKILY